MSYKKITCGKCGAEITTSKHSLVVKNLDNPTYGLLVDVCASCNENKDLHKILQDRLYPKNTGNEQAAVAMNEEKERARRYEASKKEWFAKHPGEEPPKGS